MEFWIFVIPVLIAGIIFFIVSNKKNKTVNPIHKIDLTQWNEKKQQSNPSQKQSIASDKLKSHQADNSNQIDLKKQPQNSENTHLETEKIKISTKQNKQNKVKSAIDKENRHQTTESTKQKIAKQTKEKPEQTINPKLSDQGKKQMESIASFLKKMASKASEIAKPKINDSSPKENTQPKPANSNNQTQQNLSEIYIYLKSQEGQIDGKKLLNQLINCGFSLKHEYGYIHRAMIVQDENGGLINRMNIDSDNRPMIRIYLDPNQINNEQEFTEAIGIIANLAKELECQILNLEKQAISEDDLEFIERVVFNYNR